MVAQPFQERALQHGSLLGITLNLPTPFASHIVGRIGYDFVFIDMEHSPLSAGEATGMVHAVTSGSGGRCSTLIRVPASGVEWVKWGLDSGAAGIVIPMCTSGPEVEAIVQRARYPPLGQRSFGPFQTQPADLGEDANAMKYFNQIAEGTAVIPMVESVQGLQNAEDIIRVPGVSGIFIGPVDLRLSMGLKPPFDGTEEVYIQALEKIVALGKRYNIPIGIYAATTEAMQRWKKMGFTWFLITGDTSSLTAGATSVLEGSRTTIRDMKL